MSHYVLADKARKDVVCRVPGLLREGKLDAAARCLARYGDPPSSPLLLAFANASLFADGSPYGIDKPAYGLLWTKYCDAGQDVEEGLASLDANLPRRRRFTDHERSVLGERYPTLATDPRFDAILDRPGTMIAH